jgi:HAD superfamily hydrolase (TIGR01509 family)
MRTGLNRTLGTHARPPERDRTVPTGRSTNMASSLTRGAVVHAVAKPLARNYTWKMMLPHMPVAVIFDMDGLIFDTETLYQEAFLAAATVGGHDSGYSTHHRSALGPEQSIASGTNGIRFPHRPIFRTDDRPFRVAGRHATSAIKPGVVELLDFLDQLEMPRCIATSSAHSTVQSHLSAHGLADRFHAVIGHGDYVASKPSPDPFLTAAKRLGVDPSLCLALEDSYNGVRSASAAGMMTFMVPDLLSPTPEIQSLCTGVVSDLHAVRKLILTASAAGIAG